TESITILICAASWFELRRTCAACPPLRTPADSVLIPTLTVIALFAANAFARLEGRSAKLLDRHGVRLWGALGVVMDAVVLLSRGIEFSTLNTRWDSDAYGSIIWFTLGIHTTLLLLVFLEDFFYLLVALLKPLTQDHAAHIV